MVVFFKDPRIPAHRGHISNVKFMITYFNIGHDIGYLVGGFKPVEK